LLARSANRLTEYAKHTTADVDIIARRWLLIDFDPVRPVGISSTDPEHEAALGRARVCSDWLRSLGWPAPILADSGNGAHLLYRIDLPNDPASLALVNGCMKALAFRFDDGAVVVDQTTGNAARIWKLYGTLACKGDDLPNRPYRLAQLLEVPDDLTIVPEGLLCQLAAMIPESSKKSRLFPSNDGFDVKSWIARWSGGALRRPLAGQRPSLGPRYLPLEFGPHRPECVHRPLALRSDRGGLPPPRMRRQRMA
jgi:hypothetical protein